MNRFKWWAMLLFSSTLVTATVAFNFWTDGIMFEKREIVIIAIYTSAIILAFGGVFTSMFWDGKIKTWVETILIILNLVLWIILAMTTLLGVDVARLYYIEDIAVQTGDQGDDLIIEPNIYFFSFGCFFISVYLASSWFKQFILLDENALTTTQWTFLATSGLVVMMTGISLYDDSECRTEINDSFSCSTTIFSIIVGLVSAVTSCIMIPWRSAPLKCQAEFALILLVIWAVAIGLLTFDKGPALYTNTMYFGIYLSFFLALNILNTTTYADAVLETSPYANVEFGRTESERENDAIGAAGLLDFAYANMKKSQENNGAEDPRNADITDAMLFDSVGGSLSSLLAQDENDSFVSSLQLERETKFNKKVIIGKRNLNRIEIWFILFVQSLVCLVVFYKTMDKNNPVWEQWMVAAPIVSLILSSIGWMLSPIPKRWAYVCEGILILICIVVWIRGLITVTQYFEDTTTEQGAIRGITANQLFMSYGAFFTSLYLITDWSKASTTTADWVFLCAASATIFGVLYMTHEGDIFMKCQWKKDFDQCGQLQLVAIVALGSAFISFIMVFVSFITSCAKFIHVVHVIIGTMLLSLWGVAAYFIVFVKDGYGSEIGPTFFACWGSLFFCVDITTTNLVLMCKNQSSENEKDDASVMLSAGDRDERFQVELESLRDTGLVIGKDDNVLEQIPGPDIESGSG